jgi:fatty-acyl-CoA synthase
MVEALDSLAGVQDRGLTFVGARGPGEDLTITYHALRTDVMRRAKQLRALGLAKGDRVALVIPDGQDFIPTFLGAMWAGIVPVPLYPPLSLGKLDAFMEALLTILAAAGPKVLVAGDKVEKVLWSVVGKVPSLQKLVTTSSLTAASASMEAQGDPGLPAEKLAGSDLAFLQFTSGSTSAPKGVMVTHKSLAANGTTIMVDGIEANPGVDLAVSWLPLYHDMGLIGFVLAPILGRGLGVAYIPTLSFIKNATLWMETLHRLKGTMTFAPNFAYALVTKRARPEQIARWDLSRMRIFGCGAEPINPETMRAFVDKFQAAGVKPEALLPCYGMAEATLAISFVGLSEKLKTDRIDAEGYHKEHAAKPVGPPPPAGQGAGAPPVLEVVSCGRTFPGHEVRIRGEDGSFLPERSVGEICLRGPSVAAGYFQNPEASRAAGMGPEGDGFLRTGDLGYLAGGEVYVSGRIKDILIVNGRNYYPQRIEWLVDELPGVRKGSAVVFTRPGTASEEIVVAVESRDRAPDQLSKTIAERINEEFQLAVADVRIVPPGALPKTSSGKLQRRKTRQQYLDGTIGTEGARTLGGSQAWGSRLLVAKHLAYSLVGKAQHHARGIVRRFLPAQPRS